MRSDDQSGQHSPIGWLVGNNESCADHRCMHHSLTHSLKHTYNQPVSHTLRAVVIFQSRGRSSSSSSSSFIHLFFSVAAVVVVVVVEEGVAKPMPVLPDLKRLDPHNATINGINARRLPPEDSTS